MMWNRSGVVATLALLVLPLCAVKADDGKDAKQNAAATPRYRVIPDSGDKAPRYVQASTKSVSKVVGGRAGPDGDVTEMSSLWCVYEGPVGAHGGRQDAKLLFDRFASSMKSSWSGYIDFDSDHRGGDSESYLFDEMFSLLLGKSASLNVSPDGRTITVSGMDELIKLVDEKAVVNAMWTGAKSGFTNEAVVQTLYGRQLTRLPPVGTTLSNDTTWTLTEAGNVERVGPVEWKLEFKTSPLRGQPTARGGYMIYWKGTAAAPEPPASLPAGAPEVTLKKADRHGNMVVMPDGLAMQFEESVETQVEMKGIGRDGKPFEISFEDSETTAIRPMTAKERVDQKDSKPATPKAE